MIDSTPRSENLSLPFVTILIGSLILGMVHSLIARGYMLLAFTPAVIGLGAASILSYSIWQARITDRLLAVGLGMLFVIAIFTVYLVGNYQYFVSEAMREIQQMEALSAAEARALLDRHLVNETGYAGFIGYARWQLQSGMVVQSSMMPGSRQSVSGVSIVLYGLLDIGVVLYVVIAGAWNSTRRPFCSTCGEYYGNVPGAYPRRWMHSLGFVLKDSGGSFLELIRADHLEQAGALIQSEVPRKPGHDLLFETCLTCDTGPVTLVMHSAKRGSSSYGQNPLLVKALSQEQFERLVSFARIGAIIPAAGQLGSNHRRLANMMLIFAILAGILWLISVAVPAF